MVLAFALGAGARFMGADLRLPEPVHQAITVYLLLAIGLKGGVALSQTRLADVALPLAAAVMLGAAIPLWLVPLLRRLGLTTADAAGVAAHYASVSAVTYLAAATWLDRAGIGQEGFMPALLAAMEPPGIAVAVLLARRGGGVGPAIGEVATSRSILLLLGGLLIGGLAGEAGYAPVRPFFADLFAGFLTLFLLDMGAIAARRAGELRTLGLRLVLFAIAVPLVHGALGAALGAASGLSLGGATMLAVLAASASYIAAPAAVRLALPEANPAYGLTLALAVTFPFNLVAGLPLYLLMARMVAE
jgi:hypothetical protein